MNQEKFNEAFEKLYLKFKEDPEKFSKSAKASQYLRILADHIDRQNLKIDPHSIRDLWNTKMVKLGFSPAMKMDSSSAVYKNVKQRCLKISKEFELSDEEVLGFFDSYFDRVVNSKYLSGKVNDFKANFVWVMGPKNYDKIMNGAYDGNGNT